MKTNLTRDSLDDIVFENRNKSYGAYQLRHGYHATLNRSLLITLSAFAAMAGMLLLLRSAPPTVAVVEKGPIELFDYPNDPPVPVPPVTGQKPLTTPSPPVATPLVNTYRLVSQIPEDIPVTTPAQDPMTTQANAGNTEATDGAVTGTAAGNMDLPFLPAGPIEALAADKLPEFPGGMERFYKYLRNNLVYTAQARDAGIAGKVYANFIIDAEGKIREVKILKGLGFGLDEQVIAVLSKSPAWKPAIYQGKPVASILRLPVNFQTTQ